jgi:hypothetical protein
MIRKNWRNKTDGRAGEGGGERGAGQREGALIPSVRIMAQAYKDKEIESDK